MDTVRSDEPMDSPEVQKKPDPMAIYDFADRYLEGNIITALQAFETIGFHAFSNNQLVSLAKGLVNRLNQENVGDGTVQLLMPRIIAVFEAGCKNGNLSSSLYELAEVAEQCLKSTKATAVGPELVMRLSTAKNNLETLGRAPMIDKMLQEDASDFGHYIDPEFDLSLEDSKDGDESIDEEEIPEDAVEEVTESEYLFDEDIALPKNADMVLEENADEILLGAEDEDSVIFSEDDEEATGDMVELEEEEAEEVDDEDEADERPKRIEDDPR